MLVCLFNIINVSHDTTVYIYTVGAKFSFLFHKLQELFSKYKYTVKI